MLIAVFGPFINPASPLPFFMIQDCAIVRFYHFITIEVNGVTENICSFFHDLLHNRPMNQNKNSCRRNHHIVKNKADDGAVDVLIWKGNEFLRLLLPRYMEISLLY